MVMPIIHHTIPMVVATGATTRVAERALPSRRRTTIKRKPIKRRLPVAKRKVSRKPVVKRKVVTKRRVEQRLPPGRWVQLSREELVHAVGKTKADKVKENSPDAIKVGMYDKAIYINGKYYLNIS